VTPAPSRTLGPSSASSIAMIVLMAGVILCRTNEFKHTMETDQHVAAAFVLFSSFVTLLFYVIRLFAGRRE
jgi:FtsH-binding integral membrane protein